MSIFFLLPSKIGQYVKLVGSLQKIYISISLSYVKICVYMDLSVIENDYSCYFFTLGLLIAWTKDAME